MKNRNGKWLLNFVVTVCCLSPAAFALNGGWPPPPPTKKCEPSWAPQCQPSSSPKSVPEGGSTATYLLGAGLACLGAMYVRSRVAEPRQS